VATKPRKKSSAAECALLKALGINTDGLNAGEEAIMELKLLFDSPLQQPQLQVLASSFGKTMPLCHEIDSLCARSIEINVSA
jgi:hypothetical protein